MVTLSIPQALIKEGFVVLPRREYEDLLRVKQNSNDGVIKRDSSFKVSKKHEKFYDELDKELTESLREIRNGKTIGPFSSLADGLKALKMAK